MMRFSVNENLMGATVSGSEIDEWKEPSEESYILCSTPDKYPSKTKKVIIHNTTIGGDFYKEITSEQYEVFSKKGWRLAVFVLCLSNYRRKLDMVEHNIKREVNSRKNAKHIQNLKSARERIMCSFTKVTKKINLIIKQTNND